MPRYPGIQGLSTMRAIGILSSFSRRAARLKISHCSGNMAFSLKGMTQYCCTIKLNMKIRDIRATTVTVPLEAPLRHANGCHWGRFVRTIVEVETDNGLVGLGEMGGGGESAEAVFRSLKSYLVGHDPTRLEEMRFLIANPTASLYNNRTQVLAALEFACLDILGQAWNVPVS